MEFIVPPELEELISCSCCHVRFNDTDLLPKLLTCRHYFCLKCINSILQEGNEIYCVHCWKRTELPNTDKNILNLPTYSAILSLAQNLDLLSVKTKSRSKQRSSSSTSSVNSNNGANIRSGSGNTSNAISNSNCSGNNANVNTNSEAIIAHAYSDKIKKGENCMTHAMPNTLWCIQCNILVCRACAASEDHTNHIVKTHVDAREIIQIDISKELFSMQQTLNDIQNLVLKQREFLLKVLESCTALKTQIETELINHIPTLEISEMRESLCKAKLCLDMLDKQSPADALKLYTTLHLEKQRLSSRYQEMFLQCKLDDLIRNYGMVFDFDLIKQSLNRLHSCVINGSDLDEFASVNGVVSHQNPILLLANYCISQLYSRHVLAIKHQHLLLSNNSNGYLQSQQNLISRSYNQQQQSIATSQILPSNQLSPHDEIVQVETYADKTSPPNSNQQQFHPINATTSKGVANHQTENTKYGGGGAFCPGATANVVRVSPLPPNAYISNDFNCLSVPAVIMMQHMQHKQSSNPVLKTTSQKHSNAAASLLCNPSVHVYPIYYFNIDLNGQTIGRILIEVRNDVAPKMAKNFGALATHELGFGYKGCQIFQCWENESIITGDFELNNGRGGRSVFEENFFMPDDTKILAIRGSVGMRRSQKRHDNMGLVGSQFRVILREMRGFTGIFAFVIDGLELVEKISQVGDSTGKPQSSVVILNCGKYQ